MLVIWNIFYKFDLPISVAGVQIGEIFGTTYFEEYFFDIE